MITWFEAPKEGLSPGGKIEFQTLTATENKTYSEDGVAYTSVNVNVEGGGGSSDFSTAEVTFSVVNEVGTAPEGVIIQDNNLIYSQGGAVGDGDKLIYVLYKGSQTITAYDTAQITVEGNADIIEQSEDGGAWYATIEITGDCTIHLTGENFG